VDINCRKCIQWIHFQDGREGHLSTLIKHFASGSDIDPARITPVLERIKSDTWQSDLFRLASLTWAVPVSNGYGRRLRYLVWDEHNKTLIGLIAIGDPVFNLSVRDKLIGWDVHDRSDRLANMMDAYVLGAVPPYNMLLGGKLVASLVRSRDLYDDFTETYGDTAGIISGKEKKARLLAVTTSSSLGRSSVYIQHWWACGRRGFVCGTGTAKDMATGFRPRPHVSGSRTITPWMNIMSA